jgi:hypothetical protein
MLAAKRIGAAARLNARIGGYGSRLKAGTTRVCICRFNFQTAKPVIVRLDRTIQYAAASRFYHQRLWNTVRPVKPGDDE